jgi:hypothetical protein
MVRNQIPKPMPQGQWRKAIQNYIRIEGADGKVVTAIDALDAVDELYDFSQLSQQELLGLQEHLKKQRKREAVLIVRLSRS